MDQNPTQPAPAPAPAPMPTPEASAPPPTTPVATAPAPSVQPDGGYESNPFKLLGPSWRAIRLNLGAWLILILVGLLVSVLPILVLTTTVAVNKRAGGGNAAITVVIALLAVAFVIWFAVRAIATSSVLGLSGAKGVKMKFSEAFKAARKYSIRIFLFTILFALMVGFGLILLVIPGLILATWFAMTPSIIVEEDLSLFAAMSRSKQLVKGRFWEVFGVLTVPSILNILSIIPLLGTILALIGTIAYSAAIQLRYLSLKDYKDNSKPFPAISKVNYAVVVLFVVATAVVLLASLNNTPKNIQNTQYIPAATDLNTATPSQ